MYLCPSTLDLWPSLCVPVSQHTGLLIYLHLKATFVFYTNKAENRVLIWAASFSRFPRYSHLMGLLLWGHFDLILLQGHQQPWGLLLCCQSLSFGTCATIVTQTVRAMRLCDSSSIQIITALKILMLSHSLLHSSFEFLANSLFRKLDFITENEGLITILTKYFQYFRNK